MKPAQKTIAASPGASWRLNADLRLVWASVAVAVAYYAGARIGFVLTFDPVPVSILWPPNAILLAGLLLAPIAWWKYLLAAAFFAHLVVELQGGVPTAMVLCWFVSNAAEALIGAALVRRFARAPFALDSVRNVLVFFAFAAFAAPFFSSFIDAAFVKLIGWGQSAYWHVWQTRFIGNAVAMLVVVPVALVLRSHPLTVLFPPGRRFESAALLGGVLAVSIAVFSLYRSDTNTFLYLPLPFLLWAALRYGAHGLSVAFAIVALTLMWGATHGLGPFAGTAVQSALSVHLFLISVAVPLLFLAAVSAERKHAERGLRESEERFATAFRASPDAVLIASWPGGRIIDVNDRWQTLFGHRRENVLGTALWDLNVGASKSDWGALSKALEHERALRERPFELRAWNGTLVHALVSSEHVEIAGEVCAITIIRDVTRLRRTELELQERRKQLMHFTRVARLSELSGSLAHELNQPLTAILSNAQAAQRFMVKEPLDLAEIRHILDDIVAADKRAGEVIRGLRVLMKKGESTLAPTSLNDAVRDVLVFAHSELITAGVNVTTRLAADLPRVKGDGVQLQQLLLNLVSNAVEAMQGTSRAARRLTISTAAGADGTAHLSVADTGCGLSQAQIERLFEPFHTTKEHGLGLGLPICRMIVEAHSGNMRAEANVPHGTTFHVVFPGLHADAT